MTPARAIALAVETMQAECKRLAIDANLHDRLGARYPAAKTASKRRAQLKEAIEVLNNGKTETN